MMRPRSVLGTLGALAALAGIAVVVGGTGGDRYVATVRLDNAYGLREGSVVQAGGIDVGNIDRLRLGAGDAVEAVIRLKDGEGPIGGGARVQIKAKNLLGEKYMQLSAGDQKRPMESGGVIPTSHVSVPVDLDQVLDVLDLDTRTKLKILINEAGASLVGRGADLSAFLDELPSTFDAASAVVRQVVSDNRTLGDLIDHSDALMATFAPQRAKISKLVDRAAGTVETVAARNPQLRRTLADAPRTLASLRAFLDDLKATATPLGPAARLLADTAPTLRSTLAELPAFQHAAAPTLQAATAVAPQITKLGTHASPVVRRAVPTLESLATLGRTLQPLSRTLDLSVDDLLAVLQGWSRAIQARDGLGHVFRAKVGVSVDSVRGIIGRLLPGQTSAPARRDPPSKSAPSKAPHNGSAGTPAKPNRSPVLPQLLQPLQQVPGVPQTQDAVGKLLDFLLKP
jgi:virulence factor Mce-like protein